MDMTERTACFSGHRPEKLPWRSNEEDERCAELKERLKNAVETAVSEGFTHFITGMAQGVDVYAAEAVLSVRMENPKITLECAVPYKGQGKGRSAAEKARYDGILKASDKVTTICEKYLPGCMQRRNRYLVKNSSLLIAVFSGASGGTCQTIRLANERGIRVLQLDIYD